MKNILVPSLGITIPEFLYCGIVIAITRTNLGQNVVYTFVNGLIKPLYGLYGFTPFCDKSIVILDGGNKAVISMDVHKS